MSTKWLYILVFVLVYFCPNEGTSQYLIEGNLTINQDWDRKVYLSAVNSLMQLNASSDEYIINQSSIDTTGYFKLEGENIPVEYRLYRLHICQKGDPPSTIIIGGKNQNFIHFLMQNNSNISIKTDSAASPFGAYSLTGEQCNVEMEKVYEVTKKWKYEMPVHSTLSSIYNTNQLEDELFNLSLECQYPIPALLAMHMIDPGFEDPDKLDMYQDLSKKLLQGNEEDPYLQEFIKKVNFLEFKSEPQQSKSSMLLLLIPLSLLGLWLFFGNQKMIKKKKLNSLSVAERKVMNLLKTGMSNKEISEELNISIATVKSHVNSIYSKLKIQSRKEAMSFAQS